MGVTKLSYLEGKKEHIKNYRLADFIKSEKLDASFFAPAHALGMELLLVERHGIGFLATAKYENTKINVVENPGDKLRVEDRTVGHLYVDFSDVDEKNRELAQKWYQSEYEKLGQLIEAAYVKKEAEDYIAKQLGDVVQGNNEIDLITGTLSKESFYAKLKVVERSEVVPVALIQANINDTKYFYDTYGENEGDRLVRIIADILKEESKAEYIIGRTEVDVFTILIPLVEDGEAESFCDRVQAKANAYEDERLAPSVAMGVIVHINVEETFDSRMSDVEFEMLSNKMQMKKEAGYEERKKKGQK